MVLVLILAAGLSTPSSDCAKMAYCLADAREMFCLKYNGGLPASLTPEEGPIHALADRMTAQGCAVPDDPVRCDAPPPANVAPPVDCATLWPEGER